jgi:tetratricopeptide (TPR) repeat protein
MMGSRTLIALFILCFPPSAARSQGSQPPLTKADIIGRLAAGSSPSYVAHLVKIRGVNFYPDADFLLAVDRAGGEGILLDRLRDVAPGGADSSTGIQGDSLERLAKCAEFERTGAFAKAENECRAAATLDPRSPFAALGLSHCLNQQLKKEEAVEAARAAVALAPNLPEAHAGLYLTGAPEGREEGTTALRLEPEELDLLLNLPEVSATAERDGAIEASLKVTEAVLKIEPDFAEALAYHASYLSQAHGSQEEALADLRRAVALEPGLGERHDMLSWYLGNFGQKRESLAELREAVRVEPDSNMLHATLAQHLMQENDRDGALEQYKECVRVDPDDRTAMREVVNLYEAKGNFKAAIDAIRQFLQVEPHDHDETFRLIGLLIENHEMEKAEAECQEYIRLFEEPSGYAEMGNIYFAEGRVPEAVRQYRTAIDLKPDWKELRRAFAENLVRSNNPGEAMEELQKALDLDPNDAETLNDLAWLYATSADPRYRDPAKALELARRAVESLDQVPSDSEKAAILDTLAEAQLVNQQFKEAMESEQRAISLDPGNAELKARLPRFEKAMRKAAVPPRDLQK